MPSKNENNGYHKFLEFISPFLRDQIIKGNGEIYSAVKGMSYAQALICIEIIVNTLDKPPLVNFLFVFLFPIFIGIGVFTGICESQKSDSGHALSVIVSFFAVATAFNMLSLTIMFYLQSFIFSLAFILSILAVVNLVGIGFKLTHKISRSESS